MATTVRQRRIQASLDEVNELLKEVDVVSAADKGPSFLQQLAEGEGLLDILGQRAAKGAGDWLESRLPKSIKDYLGSVEDDEDDEDEDEEEEVTEADVVEEVPSEIATHSKALDDVLAKFKKEPGEKHIDDLVKVLTEYTKAHKAHASKLEEEKKKVEEENKIKEKKQKVQQEVFKPFSEKFD
jgi:hypothetical protein